MGYFGPVGSSAVLDNGFKPNRVIKETPSGIPGVFFINFNLRLSYHKCGEEGGGGVDKQTAAACWNAGFLGSAVLYHLQEP